MIEGMEPMKEEDMVAVEPEGKVIGVDSEKSVNEEEPFQAWSVRQIEKLATRLGSVDRSIEAANGRATDLARRITSETTRINYLREKQDSHENRMSVAVTEIRDRLAALEGFPRLTRTQVGERLVQISTDQIRRAERDFCTEGQGPDTMALTNTGADLFGPKEHREITLTAAIQRVKIYMGGSFSEATIAGVVRAIGGNPYPVAAGDRTWQEPVRVPAEDMTLVPMPDEDKIPQFGAPWAKEVELDIDVPLHDGPDTTGYSVHHRRPKPIKDNPQG